MAEGGKPPIVYNFENVENLQVVHEQAVTSFDKSLVGSITIGSKSVEQRDEVFVANAESGQTEYDKVPGSEHRDKQSEMNETGITWLQNGRYGIFVKKPLHPGAKVYRGVQKLISNSRRDVAIKLLAFHEKNRREIILLLKLQHPNIVQIIDAGDHLGAVHWIYIVMELCSQNLQEYIDENSLKPRDFMKLVSFSKQLVAGLAYLHQNKVVHRDLKPENVLISMCKNFIKLSDFGMSKEIQQSRSMVTVTAIGAGSEGYRSPETYQAGSHASPRLDIFPLGLILHLLFTNGLHPFGSDPYDWSYNIRKNKNLDLSQIPEFEKPNISKRRQLLELLNRMLRHEPRDRPTADEVKNDSFFKDLLQEEGNTIDKQVASLVITSPNMVAPEHEASRYSKNSSKEGKKTIVEQVAEADVLLPSTGSLALQDLQGTEIENSSLVEKRIKELEERASKLMEMREFQNAAKVLHELYNYEGSDKLEVSFKITECELHLQRSQEQDFIRQLTDIVLTSRTFSAGELLELADKLLESKNYVRSLIVLHISHDLCKTEVLSPDNEVNWIAGLLYKISMCSEPLLKAGGVLHDIGISYGLEYMERLLNELSSVKKVSAEIRTVKEAYCLVSITHICIIAGEYRRSIHFGINGVTILENQFGADASTYKQYGMLLNNVGVGYEDSSDNYVSEIYYVGAMKHFKVAENFTEDERKKWVDRTTRNLNRIRRKIKNTEDE